jgi:hypothetical protein
MEKAEDLYDQWQILGVPVEVGGPAFDDRMGDFTPGMYVKPGIVFTSSSCDVHGNNLVPYCWYSNYGPGKWFGQEVSHWMELPEPPKEDV